MAAAIDSAISHHVFQNNPSELREFLYKEVVVDVYKGRKKRGWVYTIDPVSGSIILVNFISKQPKDYIIVLGHSVKNITIINNNIDEFKEELDRLGGFREASEQTSVELHARGNQVKNWLNKNRIPFEEKSNGELNIMDALILSPPYKYSNCTSANVIVLGKVQRLLKAMPSDLDCFLD